MNLPHLSKLCSLTRTISIESSSISIPFIPVFKHRSNKLVHRPEHATSPSSWSTLPSQLNHTNRYPFSALSLSLSSSKTTAIFDFTPVRNTRDPSNPRVILEIENRSFVRNSSSNGKKREKEEWKERERDGDTYQIRRSFYASHSGE